MAWLMRESHGAFSHEEIMRLTWRQFETYQEAFTYILNMESDDGRKRNEEADRAFGVTGPDFDAQVARDREEAYRRLKKKRPSKVV